MEPVNESVMVQDTGLRRAEAVAARRFGGIISAGVRGSRSAGRLLSSRIGWLAAVTAVVILASSQLLYATGTHGSYAKSTRPHPPPGRPGPPATPHPRYLRAPRLSRHPVACGEVPCHGRQLMPTAQCR